MTKPNLDKSDINVFKTKKKPKKLNHMINLDMPEELKMRYEKNKKINNEKKSCNLRPFD